MYSTEIVEECNDLTHNELMEITTSALCTIFQTDSILKNIPADISLEEVLSKIAVEHGKSITVTLHRDLEKPIDVIIPQATSTVLTLKKAIRRHFEIYQKRTKTSNIKISWKYIWRTYDLEHDGQKLDDDSTLISEYGVVNRAVIKFTKKKNKRHNY